jgi:porin
MITLARRKAWLAAAAFAVAAFATAPASADDKPTKDGIPEDSIATILPGNGDPGGIRKRLAERGFTYGFVLTSEAIANAAGGVRRGAIFDGKLEVFVNADLEKMLGARGLSAFANMFQIHGSGGISRDYVGGFNTISNIEALPTTRLSEAWFEQKFFADTVSLRVGQLAADAEFFISDQSVFFMNSDWPAITKQDLPSGGAAYPLSTPGVRLKVTPNDATTFLLALFNGDPSGPGPADPEIKNHYGVNFRVQDPPFLIGELQYRYNQGKDDTGLAGIVRLGAWHHFGEFDSQRFDAAGLSLANPLSSGIAARLRGNSGIYGVIDQQVYRPRGAAADEGVQIFSRVSLSPSDRNPVNFYLDGGIVFSGMVPGRKEDKFGATFIYSNISSAARALDRDAIIYSGQAQPVRDYEMNIAVAYMAQIVPGWTLQPEFHYVIHPGGHIAAPAPANPSVPIKNASVFALRSVIKY